VTFPAGLTTITVTGTNIETLDGTPLSGVIIFTPSEVVAAPAVSALLEGSATAEVVNGTITQPFVIPTTDCITPPFTYTITDRLQRPEGTSPPPVTGVSIPHTLGATVDISALIPA
jgi:hypothetical protein